ncbi:MAG TPA: lipoyl(octanoyl) transferase LipB [Candidatus Eisenbacteria bacterium]|nr:lipoyl(octanoyl) transferase LipB [Candidatus Eisenbacteria bacterium]
MTHRVLETSFLGRVSYEEGLRLQEERVAGVQAGTLAEALFLLEHDPVLTLGRSSHSENIVASQSELLRLGIRVFECGRGGDVTYHGPGQLVGYPILNLSPDRKDVWKYVRGLEEALIRALADYGITAGRFERLTGVWVGQEKIAAIGVRVSRWVTSHGFALNVTTNLDHFRTIVPCGIRSYGVTSMARHLDAPPRLEDVGRKVAVHLGAVFDREPIWTHEAVVMGRHT